MEQFKSYSFQQQNKSEYSFRLTFVFSVIFHAVVFLGIPVLLKFAWKPRTFQRPQTFQLVSPMQPVKPQQRAVRKEVKPEPKPEPAKKDNPKKDKTPEPKKEATKPVEENLDELASVLEELPAPARVAAVGDFKFHWYLNNVQQKLERYWNPPTENQHIKVVVHFVIYKDGNISDPKIIKSSGSSTVDNLALRAVNLASPFGKLPPGFSGDKLDLSCTLIPTRK